MSLASPVEVRVVCPYCGSQQVISFSHIYPSTEEVFCHNPKCEKEWHQGTFRSSIVVVDKQEKRGFGKDRPTLYTIRCKTDSGGEDLISFQSMDKGIMMKKGDAVAFDFRKRSKGIFRKEWTGEWESKPAIFQNLKLNHYWHV